VVTHTINKKSASIVRRGRNAKTGHQRPAAAEAGPAGQVP